MDATAVLSRVPAAAGVRDRLRAAVLDARGRLAGAAPAGALAHAWLFTGPPGSGRSTAAYAFAAALLCTDPDDPGCGRCEGCRTALAGTHAELLRVATEANQFHVEYIKGEVIPWLYRRPTTAAWRVAVVEDADRLLTRSGKNECANALLKVVEEPPERTIIVFCAPSTDPADFSVTLRSRCRHVHLPTPAVADIAALLRAEQPELPAEQVDWAAAVAAGHIGRARGLLLDEDTRAWRGRALDLVEAVFDPSGGYLRARDMGELTAELPKRHFAELEERELSELEESLGIGARGRGAQAATRGTKHLFKELEEQQKRRRARMGRDLLDQALTDVAMLYRDALTAALGAGSAPLVPDRARTAAELARRLPPEALLRCIDAVTAARGQPVQVQPTVILTGLVGSLQRLGRVGVR